MNGIIKSKTLRSGAVGEFWAITKVSADLLAGQCSFTLSLYVNQAAAQTGAAPLTSSKVYNLTVTPSELTGDLRTWAWGKITTQANSMVTRSITGELLDSPVVFDADLAGGTQV